MVNLDTNRVSVCEVLDMGGNIVVKNDVALTGNKKEDVKRIYPGTKSWNNLLIGVESEYFVANKSGKPIGYTSTPSVIGSHDILVKLASTINAQVITHNNLPYKLEAETAEVVYEAYPSDIEIVTKPYSYIEELLSSASNTAIALAEIALHNDLIISHLDLHPWNKRLTGYNHTTPSPRFTNKNDYNPIAEIIGSQPG